MFKPKFSFLIILLSFISLGVLPQAQAAETDPACVQSKALLSKQQKELEQVTLTHKSYIKEFKKLKKRSNVSFHKRERFYKQVLQPAEKTYRKVLSKGNKRKIIRVFNRLIRIKEKYQDLSTIAAIDVWVIYAPSSDNALDEVRINILYLKDTIKDTKELVESACS